MTHRILIVLSATGVLWGLTLLSGCTPKPSKVEQMRAEKARKDSITYVQAQQNLHYSDSLLQELLPQVDPLLQSFVYSKEEAYEDHGHYVHRLLQTSSNTSRNYLQAYVTDDRTVSVQSYYYGAAAHQQRAVRATVGEEFVELEGINHAFEAEGQHEILTIEDDDAMQLLFFLTNHEQDRIRITSIGKQSVVYVLTDNERKALADTYRLAILMRNIDVLERAIHVANLQIKKYEQRKQLTNEQH
ncbi:MAG: hypothetical protein MJZ65_03810 [Paludibacteraceae bacterium]|nr:hypothetical protein [Paludibacteraceae bacterium]